MSQIAKTLGASALMALLLGRNKMGSNTINFAMMAFIAASIAGCGRSSSENSKGPSASEITAKVAATPDVVSTPAVVDNYKQAMPAIQTAFIDIITRSKLAYSQAENDMKSQSILVKRGKEICAAIPNYSFKNWTGRIIELGVSTLSGDRGYITIGVGDEIEIGTSMGELATSIDPESLLFKSVSELEIGDEVKFSGNFIEGYTSDYDCIRNSRAARDTRMNEPFFLTRFTSVEKLESR